MSNFIPRVFEFKAFLAPTAIFKDFHGLEFLFYNSRTFKVRSNPVFLALFKKNKDHDQDHGLTPLQKCFFFYYVQLTCNFLWAK